MTIFIFCQKDKNNYIEIEKIKTNNYSEAVTLFLHRYYQTLKPKNYYCFNFEINKKLLIHKIPIVQCYSCDFKIDIKNYSYCKKLQQKIDKKKFNCKLYENEFPF